jgi:hypothetical protein
MTQPEECEWYRPECRELFTLAPFKIRGQDAASVLAGGIKRLQKGGDSEWLLTAAWERDARVQRYHGAAEGASRAAVALARETGDPVVVGRQVGLDSEGMPVFEAVGRVMTAKADPLSAEAFESWAEALAGRMGSVSRADLAAMGTEALEHLELVLRPGTSVAQLERALAGYRTTIASPTARMMSAQRVEITRTLQRVLARSGARAARIPQVRATLATGFQVRDREASRLLARHHSFWVRDRHGEISRSMSDRARGIISSGLDRGLGRAEIGRELSQMTGRGLRQPHYYQTVAANQVARARSYALGSTYRAAGIEFYRIEAVLDDRTTHQCEFLHEKILPSGPGTAALERTMASPNPEAVVTNQPFIEDMGDHLSIPTAGGGSARVATITERSSGASPSGVSARFSGGMDQAALVSQQVGFPPYHHQ